jgi:hypothetical protein
LEREPESALPDANGDSWLVAADIYRVLDLADPHPIIRVVDEDKKRASILWTPLCGRQDRSVGRRRAGSSVAQAGGMVLRSMGAVMC